MNEDKQLLEKIGRKDGMTVPQGFFDDFADRMTAQLETTDFELSASLPAPKRSFWHRVRPYVYMAAMFAGIWCMLKMFAIMTSTSTTNLATSPTMAEALGNEVFVNEYIIADVNQWDVIDQMMEDGVSIDALSFDDEEAPADIDQ